MKKRRKVSVYVWAVIVVVATSVSSAGPGVGDAMRRDDRPAVVVYVDPLTGEIIDVPPVAKSPSNVLVRPERAPKLSVEPLPGGGFKIDVTGLALSYVIATVDRRAAVHTDCVSVDPRVASSPEVPGAR